MRYFAVFLIMQDVKKSAKYRPEHLSYLEKMRNEGHVKINGKFSDGSGGLVIYQAPSYKECEELVKRDPYILEGARSYEIKEWEAVWPN